MKIRVMIGRAQPTARRQSSITRTTVIPPMITSMLLGVYPGPIDKIVKVGDDVNGRSYREESQDTVHDRRSDACAFVTPDQQEAKKRDEAQVDGSKFPRIDGPHGKNRQLEEPHRHGDRGDKTSQQTRQRAPRLYLLLQLRSDGTGVGQADSASRRVCTRLDFHSKRIS